ncbi:hypothetical protein Tco_0484323 [Tanacetum coccineum]
MPNRKKRECGIRLILASKLAKATFTTKRLIKHGSVKIPREDLLEPWLHLAYESWPPRMEGKGTLGDLEGWYMEVFYPTILLLFFQSEVKETKPRCAFCGSIGFQISRESTMFPFCLAGRTIGFWKLDELGEECSHRLLREDDGLGLELVEDEASSSKRFLPAMAKDSFRC